MQHKVVTQSLARARANQPFSEVECVVHGGLPVVPFDRVIGASSVFVDDRATGVWRYASLVETVVSQSLGNPDSQPELR